MFAIAGSVEKTWLAQQVQHVVEWVASRQDAPTQIQRGPP